MGYYNAHSVLPHSGTINQVSVLLTFLSRGLHFKQHGDLCVCVCVCVWGGGGGLAGPENQILNAVKYQGCNLNFFKLK